MPPCEEELHLGVFVTYSERAGFLVVGFILRADMKPGESRIAIMLSM